MAREKDHVLDLGGGVRIVHQNAPPRMVLDADLETLCQRFEPKLIANLLRAHAGANRLVALIHFALLNGEHVDPDSVSYARNHYFFNLSIYSYMKEITKVLSAIGHSQIDKVVAMPEPWKSLQDVRSRWTAATSSSVRDDLMFHLGREDATTKAVKRNASVGMRIVLHEINPNVKEHTWCTGAESILFEASGLTLLEIDSVASLASADIEILFTGLNDILLDLLTQCGATIPMDEAP